MHPFFGSTEDHNGENQNDQKQYPGHRRCIPHVHVAKRIVVQMHDIKGKGINRIAFAARKGIGQCKGLQGVYNAHDHIVENNAAAG